MNGFEMRAWRTAAGLTLRDVATTYLSNEVTHTTLSRWEQSDKAIPQWACDIFLGATKITLAVNEMHALLDYAKAHDQSFNEVLAEAIRDWLRQQNKKNIRTPIVPARVVATSTEPANSVRVAEAETAYRAAKE